MIILINYLYICTGEESKIYNNSILKPDKGKKKLEKWGKNDDKFIKYLEFRCSRYTSNYTIMLKISNTKQLRFMYCN